jgi:hypothetical protein
MCQLARNGLVSGGRVAANAGDRGDRVEEGGIDAIVDVGVRVGGLPCLETSNI